MINSRPVMIQVRRAPVCLPLFFLGVVAVSPTIARVEVNVTHVGFPGIGRGDIIRAGCWTPILVDLSLVDQAEFHGSLRAAQFDDDGDRSVDSVEVHLRAETGGTARRTLYVPANPAGGNPLFQVELRDAEGAIVRVFSQGVPTTQAMPADAPSVVSHDDVVILSVGKGAIGKIKDLTTPNIGGKYKRNIIVAHVSPEDLPELWIGLESVDYIVWEDARAEDLTPRQLDAVIEWVRHGGTLLVAASRTAASLRLARPLDAVLPVDLGELASVANLPMTRERLLGTPGAEEIPADLKSLWYEAPLPQPVSVVRCTLREGALRVVGEKILLNGSEVDSEVVSRRREQRGQVIYCAVSLHDLFSGLGNAPKFFEKLFYFLIMQDSQQGAPTPLSLFNNVAGAVGFIASRSVYLLIAALFSLSYLALATFGTWAFLSSRGWRHQSWSAFAVVAAAASVLSVTAVGSIRGVTDRLEQIAVIDADVDSSHGRGTAFFGLKSGVDKRLDFWLPSDWLSAREPVATSCFLKPLPVGREWGSGASSFADPAEYRVKPASAEIEDVRLRATLKRVEGRWEGPLGGKLSARVSVRKGLITDDSYVINQLGVDLKGCRLIHTVLSPEDVAAERGTATFVFPLGDIPSNGLKTYLAPRCYALSGSETIGNLLRRSELKAWHDIWSDQFRGLLPSINNPIASDAAIGLGRERDALMLLSTLGDFDPAILSSAMAGSQTWSADRLRQLDLRDQLRGGRVTTERTEAEPGMMILIGFAEGGGPVRLFVRSDDEPYAPFHPDDRHSWCMYRLRIPFALLDASTGNTLETPAP